MWKLTIERRSEKWGGMWKCTTKRQCGTLIVLRRCRFVRRWCFWYTRCWASFEKGCSISWDEMNMNWNNEWVLIPDVQCHTGYWSTVVIYCAHRQQYLRIGMYVKYIEQYWMSNNSRFRTLLRIVWRCKECSRSKLEVGQLLGTEGVPGKCLFCTTVLEYRSTRYSIFAETGSLVLTPVLL